MTRPNAGNPEKLEAPLDEVVVLRTNLSPQHVADELFPPRVGRKNRKHDASPEERVAMFRTECARPSLVLRAQAFPRAMNAEPPPRTMPRGACRSSDIPTRVADVRRYGGRTPVPEVEFISGACPDSVRCDAVAGLPKPVRRENTAAGDLPNSPSSPMRILLRALPASFFSLAFTVVPIDLLRNGKWTSLFRLFSQGIVAFLFVLRKDAVSLSHRP